jgi:hypothetical protein
MFAIGERQEAIQPEFDKSISVDFQGATITSDTIVVARPNVRLSGTEPRGKETLKVATE